MTAFYTHHLEGCFGTRGLDVPVYQSLLARLAPARDQLCARSDPRAAALLDLPAATDDLDGINQLASDIKSRFTHVVVAGSGGSGLSGRLLVQMSMANMPVMHFLENIDPDSMQAMLERTDPAKTCFLIVSKSGTTVETLSQFYVLLHLMESTLGKEAVARQCFIITMPGSNPLRTTAAQYGIPVLDHAENIGGRFSALTNVGLLPAAIAGLDIHALREGAHSVVQALETGDIKSCAPAMGAALQYTAIQLGRPITVMLPYSERLSGFSAWYRQSWAESLGKGGKGSTPIRAVGTTDQHSQLQLYLDGPKDKLYTMIMQRRAGTGHPIAAPKELAHLAGKTLGDVMEAEQRATYQALLRNGCPVRLIQLETLAEKQMGALLMHFTLEIIFMAALLGVNPYDQPAVEEGKQLAREYLLGGSL